jgi:hypothetical protein
VAVGGCATCKDCLSGCTQSDCLST